MSLSDIAASVRREEYTGENRCVPCTVVNTGLALAVAGAVAWAGFPLAAAVTLIACLGVIYLWGYLIPGTPTLTQRYFPEPLLRLFGKETASAPGHSAQSATADHAGVVDALVAAGVLADDDPELDPVFRERWHDHIRAVRDRELGPADVCSTLGVEECTAHGNASFVVGGTEMVRWESEAALVADVAAAAELSTALPEWDQLDHPSRLDLLTGLRLFLDRCPACDGSVARTGETVDPCCQPAYAAVQSACEACDTTLANASVVEPEESTPPRVQFLAGVDRQRS